VNCKIFHICTHDSKIIIIIISIITQDELVDDVVKERENGHGIHKIRLDCKSKKLYRCNKTHFIGNLLTRMKKTNNGSWLKSHWRKKMITRVLAFINHYFLLFLSPNSHMNNLSFTSNEQNSFAKDTLSSMIPSVKWWWTGRRTRRHKSFFT
jgi:hypothetical protein